MSVDSSPPRSTRGAAGGAKTSAASDDSLSRDFRLVTDFIPKGDQPEAIRALVEGVSRGDPHQTLLGVTGSGKSFTIACVVEQLNRPTLVMAPNKTLAAQLYAEFSELFPDNAIEYFVSYYDYYQPEAYVPSIRYLHREGRVDQRGHRADSVCPPRQARC